MLERLDSVSDSVFTADYDILTKMGNVTSTATVVQARPDRRSITINDVRFLYDDAAGRHLRPDDRRVRGDDQRRPGEQRVGRPRVLRPELRPAPARRRRPAGRRTAGLHDHAGRTNRRCASTCRSPAEPSPTARSSNGALARYDGADLFIEMTTYSDVVDETKFATS